MSRFVIIHDMSGVEVYKTDTYTNQNGAYAIS